MLDNSTEKVHIGAELLPSFTTDSFIHPEQHNEDGAPISPFKGFSAPADAYGRGGAAGNFINVHDASAGKAHDVPEETAAKRNTWPL